VEDGYLPHTGDGQCWAARPKPICSDGPTKQGKSGVFDLAGIRTRVSGMEEKERSHWDTVMLVFGYSGHDR